MPRAITRRGQWLRPPLLLLLRQRLRRQRLLRQRVLLQPLQQKLQLLPHLPPQPLQ